MKAEELMLGNWVRINKNFGWDAVGNIKVINIRRDSINHMQDGNVSWSIPESELIGIELSPEILEKAGFVKNSTGTFVIDSPNKIVPSPVSIFIGKDDNVGYYLGISNLIMDSVIIKKIQYLHDLQNIYYQLTHTPLKIEL